jgi:hypothetical protein
VSPRRAAVHLVVLIYAAGVGGGCAHEQPPRFDLKARRTCLVLSVGGPAGVAHIGAIAALEEANIRVDCVVGNSMGALVGSLYATAPSDDLDARFKAFVGAYADATRQDALRNGIGLGLVAGGLAARVGSKAATVAFAGGAALGVMATEKPSTGGWCVRTFLQRRFDSGLPSVHDLLSGGDEHRRRACAPTGPPGGESAPASPALLAITLAMAGRPIDPGGPRFGTPVKDACSRFDEHAGGQHDGSRSSRTPR